MPTAKRKTTAHRPPPSACLPGNPKPMRAVILDMDGVIVDSEHQWKLAEGPFFRAVVPGWREEDHKKIVGLGVVDLYHWLAKEYRIAESKESFLARCHELALEIYGRRVSLTEGLLDLLSELGKGKLSLGLASSSPRAWIDIVLSRFGLKEHFAAVVSGDEVPGKNKPEPDIYLLAARRLGIEPARCVTIEDSFLGVQAAKKAGMICAGFRNGTNDDQDLSQADRTVRSFSELRGSALWRPLALPAKA